MNLLEMNWVVVTRRHHHQAQIQVVPAAEGSVSDHHYPCSAAVWSGRLSAIEKHVLSSCAKDEVKILFTKYHHGSHRGFRIDPEKLVIRISLRSGLFLFRKFYSLLCCIFPNYYSIRKSIESFHIRSYFISHC